MVLNIYNILNSNILNAYACGTSPKNASIVISKALLKTLKYKESLSRKNGWSVLFWLNHDYARLISKVRAEKDAKNAQISLAALMYMLKGTPIVYNGEEIGMENYPFKSPADFKDVNAKMIFDNAKDEEEVKREFERLKEFSRDHSRTVMQWNGTKNAGFSAAEPWTYVNSNYKKVNAEKSIKDKDSIFNNYAKLFEVRNAYGEMLITAKYKFYRKKGCVGYKITGEGCNLEVVANLSTTERPIDMQGATVLYTNITNKNAYNEFTGVILEIPKTKNNIPSTAVLILFIIILIKGIDVDTPADIPVFDNSRICKGCPPTANGVILS